MASEPPSRLGAEDVRDLVALLVDPVTEVRRAAAGALDLLPLDAATATRRDPTVVPDLPLSAPGVVRADAAEWAAATGEARSILAGDGALPAGAPGAGIVTALLAGLAVDPPGDTGPLLAWVAAHGSFRPDLDRLFGLYRRLLEDVGPPAAQVDAALDPAPPGGRVRRDVAWVVSRAGVRPALAALGPRLRSSEDDVRLAAACLVGEMGVLHRDVGAGPDPAPDVEPVDDTIIDFDADGIEPAAGVSGPLPGAVGPDRPSLGDLRDRPPRRPVDHDVQFTVFRPSVVAPEAWYRLLAIAHRSEPFLLGGRRVDPVAGMRRSAENRLGTAAHLFGSVGSDSALALPRGDELVFTPWLEDAEIRPPSVAVRWERPEHTVEFRIRAAPGTAGRRLRGGLRIQLGVLQVGHVPFTVRAAGDAPRTDPPAEPVSAAGYRNIFASYAHEDTAIVERITETVAVTGDRYLRDSQHLRAGQVWSRQLAAMIDRADLFQLFWSRNAMTSPYVRDEWEHALGRGIGEFVRPVYWERPLPRDPVRGLPPPQLSRLHFHLLAPELVGAPPGSPCANCGTPLPSAQAAYCPVCGVPNAARHVGPGGDGTAFPSAPQSQPPAQVGAPPGAGWTSALPVPDPSAQGPAWAPEPRTRPGGLRPRGPRRSGPPAPSTPSPAPRRHLARRVAVAALVALLLVLALATAVMLLLPR